MKKQFLSVTALVAVALMAASGTAVAKAKKPKLTVGGYQSAGYTYVNNGDAGGANTGGLLQSNDGEIHFKISGQLANGVKIAAKVELEAGSGDGGAIDEDQVSFTSPSWGQVILGDTDSASMRIVTGNQGGWATSLYSIPFERGEMVPAPANFEGAGPGFSTRATLGDPDGAKIIWISPKFGGVQFGWSFMRDGVVGPDNITSQTSAATASENHWTTGIKYTGKVGKATVGVSAGYLRNKIPAIGDEISAVVAGISYATGPWKVAFGYHVQDDPRTGVSSTDGMSYEAGIKYTAGAHKFSVAGFHGEIEANTTVAGDDNSDTVMLAHTYAVGPGVTWSNALSCTNWNGEGDGAGEDQSGCGLHASIKLAY